MGVSRIVFMGTPDFAVPPLIALREAGMEIVGVITQPDRRKGRGKKVTPPPVKETAVSLGLPVFQPVDPNAEEAARLLTELSPDVIITAAFGCILRENVLNLPPLGCLNLHASLLPKYRGAAPVAWAIMNGESETGVTVMKMDAGMDTGPILATRVIPILTDDTTETLTRRLAEIGADLLIETLRSWVEGRLTPVPQDNARATYAPPLKKSDGKIDWTWPADRIERMIRAMVPWPGAFTRLDGKYLKILRAKVVQAPRELPAGHAWVEDAQWLVGTGSGALSLLEVQLEGKKRMDVPVFLQGFKKRGELLFDS